MNSPAEKLLFENAVWRLTTHGLLRNGGVREVELPKSAPAGFPRYVGDIPVLAAAYNSALAELNSIRTEEGLLRAGASWNGVWTRDTAYAAALGGALG